MDDLLQRLEGMGTTGGLISLGAALILVALGIALMLLAAAGPSESTLMYAFEQDGGQSGEVHVPSPFLAISGLIAFVFALAPAVIGVRAMAGSRYPSASEVFPSMDVAAIEHALATAEETQCVCTSCRVMVPAAFSTGSCPVCASSLEYHEVESEEDARLVIAAMG